MKAIVVRWTPWALLLAALGLFLFIPDANGLAVAAIWGLIIVASRVGIGLLPDRTARLWADSLLAFVCLLAGYEGGWYLLPAVIAFAIQDWQAGDMLQRPGSKSRSR